MMNYIDVPAGTTIPVFFDTFAGATGASITLTGLAVTDIEIYKGTSMTQRASDNGYALIDTDGIDLDGITGIHGFSIDLSDNSDAGFYTAGSFYNVVVSTVTIDSQTVSFIAMKFRIVAAESSAGTPKADMTHILGTAVSTPATAGILDVNVKNIDNDAASASGTVTFPNATLASTTNITAGTITTVTNLTNLPSIPNNWITAAGINTGAITSAKFAAGAIDAAAIAADAIGASELAADAVTEIQSGLATAASIAALNNLSSAQVTAAVPTAAQNAAATLTTAMTESYSTDGGTMTLAQALYQLCQYNQDRAISSTTMTVKKVDGTTTAYTITLDDATTPSSVSRTG